MLGSSFIFAEVVIRYVNFSIAVEALPHFENERDETLFAACFASKSQEMNMQRSTFAFMTYRHNRLYKQVLRPDKLVSSCRYEPAPR